MACITDEDIEIIERERGCSDSEAFSILLKQTLEIGVSEGDIRNLANKKGRTREEAILILENEAPANPTVVMTYVGGYTLIGFSI